MTVQKLFVVLFIFLSQMIVDLYPMHLESLKNKHSKANKRNASEQLKSHHLADNIQNPFAPSVQYVSCHCQVNELNRKCIL